MKFSSKFLKKVFRGIKKTKKKHPLLRWVGGKKDAPNKTNSLRFIVNGDGEMMVDDTSEKFEMEWSNEHGGAECTPPPTIVVSVDPAYLQKQQSVMSIFLDDDASDKDDSNDSDDSDNSDDSDKDYKQKGMLAEDPPTPPHEQQERLSSTNYYRPSTADDTLRTRASRGLSVMNSFWTLGGETMTVNSVVQWGDYSVAIVPARQSGWTTTTTKNSKPTRTTYSFVEDDYSTDDYSTVSV